LGLVARQFSHRSRKLRVSQLFALVGSIAAEVGVFSLSFGVQAPWSSWSANGFCLFAAPASASFKFVQT